jgi:hypothetical protein
MSMNFAQALKASLVEKDVESAYRQGIRQHFQASDPNAKITSPYGCDGLLHVPSTGLTALLEFKYDLDFKKPLLVGMVLHLHAWDAGWYQVKRIASVFLKADLAEFSKLYKALEANMTEATYEVGFLRR